MVTRVIEGSGSALAYTVFLPLLSVTFSSHQDRAISARTCGSQFGKNIGFVLGGVVFTLLGYCGEFLAMGLLTILALFIGFHFQEHGEP